MTKLKLEIKEEVDQRLRDAILDAIGEGITIIADVKAKTIKGDDIKIEGRVKGDIICNKRLELTNSARIVGNIETPILLIAEGALLKGDCSMPVEDAERKESTSKKKEE